MAERTGCLEDLGRGIMRVLLTGHRGYIGSVLAPLLKASGHIVTGLDTDLFRRCTFGPQQIPDIPQLNKDTRDVSIVDLEGFEAVIHLAGLSNDPLGSLNPELTHEINYSASARLARMAKSAGFSRFLFASSCSVYGAAGDDWIYEDGELRPLTPYGRSKAMAEEAISGLADRHFNPTFLRSATAYGVSARLRFDLVLNNLVAWACSTGRVYIKGDGSPWRPLVHIRDISRAYISILEAPWEVIHDQSFNVGSTSENYRVRELAEIVQETVPDCRIEYAPKGGPDGRCYRVSCEKIKLLLPAFRPRWNARRGAQELFEELGNTALCERDFEGPRYSRIEHVKLLLASGRLNSDLRWKESPVLVTG